MTNEETLKELQDKLSKTYIDISAAYKRMSKAKDLLSRQIIQSGIDHNIKTANELSDKTEDLKRQIMKDWSESMKDKPNKSQYD
jgi:hypothetical protein